MHFHAGADGFWVVPGHGGLSTWWAGDFRSVSILEK